MNGSSFFGKGGSSILANCFVALRPPFPIFLIRCVQVFSLQSAQCCKLTTGRGSACKTVTSLLSETCYLFLSSSLPGISHSRAYPGRTISSSSTIPLQWLPGHYLSGNDTADEFARKGMLLQQLTIPCGQLFRTHFPRTVLLKFCDT